MRERIWNIAQDLVGFELDEKTYRRVDKFLDYALLVGSILGIALAAEFFWRFLA